MNEPTTLTIPYSAHSCTYSGVRVDLLNPRPDTLLLEDIASALSKIARFNGHNSDDDYGVSDAEHSVAVSYMVPREYGALALLHDAAEAYVGDMHGGLKKLFPLFIEVENRILKAIFDKFGVVYDTEEVRVDGEFCGVYEPVFKPRPVDLADVQALQMERDLFMPDAPWWPVRDNYIRTLGKRPMPPREAKRLFLNRFNELVDAGLIGKEHRYVF